MSKSSPPFATLGRYSEAAGMLRARADEEAKDLAEEPFHAGGFITNDRIKMFRAAADLLDSALSETREIEALRIERDVAQARHERAMQFLTRIYAFLNPPFVTTQGKTYSFQNPDANETLQVLSDAIRAIPEDLRSAPSAIARSDLYPAMAKPIVHGQREQEDYRRALEAIIADPEADAVAIAHAAITPYTPWVAVDE